MITYEALIIFKPSVENDGLEGSIRAVESYVKALKGRILRLDRIGRKRLAYPIQRQKEGYIINMLFEAFPNRVIEMNNACRLNEDILRLSLLRPTYRIDLDKPSIVTPVTSRERGERDTREMGRGRFGGRGGGGGRFGGGGGSSSGDYPQRASGSEGGGGGGGYYHRDRDRDRDRGPAAAPSAPDNANA
ncbi:MAG: 30S ribosomal protein S6 [Candidatus Melainabacteria bacterium]|nr:30S ribosomal protein S6 [Candidatus Melainabacteria bacterium]